jgi:hypothetical protein
MKSRSMDVLTRSSLALVCALACFVPVNAGFAQEAGLRGTTNDTLVEDSQNTLRRAKLKRQTTTSRLANKESVQILERYQPAALEPVDRYADPNNTQAETQTDTLSAIASNDTQLTASSSDVSQADGPVTTSDVRNGNAATLDTRPIGAVATAAPLQSEIPEPFTRQSSDGSLQRDDVGRVESENDRTGSIEGKDIASETDPYAAPGLRAGTFVLRPTFESGLRYSNNPNDPTCDCFANSAESKLLLRAESDWLRHAMNIEAEVNLKKAFSNKTGVANIDTLENGLRLSIDGRSDVTKDDQITASASFEHAREVLDTSSTASFAERPMVNSLRGSVGYTHDAGVIGLSGRLNLVRQSFGDGIDLTGATIAQDDRDYTNVTGTLRGTYEFSPVFSPFVEAELGRRAFDNKLDALGIANSSTRYALRVGSEINFGEKLNGELAGGWFIENIDDLSLNNVSGFDLRGTMNWSPMRDTNVALSLGTQVDGARTSGSSTSVLYSGSAVFTRRMRANLDATATLSAAYRDFQGAEASQTTLTAEVGGTWWFNRFTGVKGMVMHNSTLSSDATRKRSATGVYLGIVLRR